MFNSLWMYTMNRCLFAVIKFVPFFTLCFSTSLSAQSQLSEPLPVNEQAVQTAVPGLRKFPEKALRGKMKVVQAPEILIDGKQERLSPGSRIRDQQHRLVMSASITNQAFTVNFVRNSMGEVHEVWILTDAEIKQKMKTATPASNIVFASQEGAIKVDDGNTPFNQLPSYEQLGRQQREQQPKR
jgi:hypothetical protein